MTLTHLQVICRPTDKGFCHLPIKHCLWWRTHSSDSIIIIFLHNVTSYQTGNRMCGQLCRSSWSYMVSSTSLTQLIIKPEYPRDLCLCRPTTQWCWADVAGDGQKIKKHSQRSSRTKTKASEWEVDNKAANRAQWRERQYTGWHQTLINDGKESVISRFWGIANLVIVRTFNDIT